jgi:membrane protein
VTILARMGRLVRRGAGDAAGGAGRVVDALDRAQRRRPWLGFPVAVWKKFGDDQAGDLAALIAYYTFVAIFPLLLVFLTILNIVLRHNTALHARLLEAAERAFPKVGVTVVGSVHVNGLHKTGLALVIGLIIAFLGARGAAGAMQYALNSIWAIPMYRRPRFPWSMLRSLALVLVVGLGLLFTTGLSVIAGGVLHLLPGALATAGTIAVSFILNFGLFWLAFRLATAADVSWTQLRLAAVLSAASWQVLQLLGSYVIGHTLRHANALYGFFGVVLGLLAWLYLQAQVTIYAVEACTVREWRLWPRGLAKPPTAADREANRRYMRASERQPAG